MTKAFKWSLLAGIAGMTAPADVAFAQEAPAAGSIYGSDEIVVTANKREENLNDVGLTVTAITGDALAQKRIVSMSDLSAAVPGLVFASSTANTPILTIRGVGFNESSLGVYPAVSVYLDEAPLPFPVMGMHAAYDVQRVEVLKGPQGTLFGQNSTGGAINFVANKPTDSLEAGLNLGYGRFNQIEGSGHLSGPLGETVGARVAFTALKSDDWQRSASRPGDTNGGEEYYAGRLILDFEPSDSLRFSLNLNAWQDKSDPQAQQHIAVRSKTPSAPNAALIIAEPFTVEKPRAADWSVSAEPRSNRKQYQAALRADLDLSDDITLTSLTNYVRFKEDDTVDADGTPLVLGDLWNIKGDIKTFTQELRLSNDPANRLRWLIGGNYEKSKTSEAQDFKFDNLTSSRPTTLNINRILGILEQDIETIAAFGSFEFDVSEQLTLKASARYTDSTNDSSNCGLDNGDGNVARLFTILGGRLGGGAPFDPLVAGVDCIALNFANIPPGDPYTDKLSEDNVSWRVGLDYKASDDVLLYANASRGYKAGSYPSLPAASTWKQLLPVTQESVTAYEAGFKISAMDGRAQVNAAAFYYDYKDKQVRGKLFDPVFSALDALINVDKSRLLGMELDARIRPVEGLTLSGAVTYLDSKIKQEVNYDVLGVLNDFSGDPLPYTPKWAYSVDAEYRYPVGAGNVYAGVTLHGQTKQDSNLAANRLTIPPGPFNGSLVDKPFEIEAYDLLDLRAGYDGETWSVGFWAKNVTNKYYYTSVIAGSDTFSRFAGKPATYGITVGFKYR